MTGTSNAAIQPSIAVPSGLLAARLARLRRKHVSTGAFTGLALAVGVGLELLALALFVDWWLDLPWGVRLVLLVGQAAVFAYITLRFIAAPLLHPPDDDELALMVEKARPQFRSRLIASIQLTRPGAIPPGASPIMVDAMVEETEAIAAPLDFNDVVPTDRLKKLGALTASVTVLAGMVLAFGGPDVRALLRRAFLAHVPVPRKTRVIVLDGHKTIGRGDSVRLEAYAQGIIPSRGRLVVEYRGRRAQEFSLEQDTDHRAHFGRTLDNVQDSFDYVIHLNDGRSETFAVKALPRPTVVTIECEQQFPTYTQLKPVRRSLGDLTLLAGSRLHLKVTASKEIRVASIKAVGTISPGPRDGVQSGETPTNGARTSMSAPGKAGSPEADKDGRASPTPPPEVPLQVSPQNRKELVGQLPIPARGLSGFSIQMVDLEGMESRDAAVYRVEILPDKVPVVRITYPDRKEELYTRQAAASIGFEATDDFAIARVRLRYQVDTLDNGEAKSVEMDLAGEQPPQLRRRYEWKLGEFSPLLKEGSVIEYWLEAQDNNDATGPGVGASDHQFAKIVSEAEKRADLLNRAGDYLGSVNDIATDQEKVNKNLGTIIREKITGR
jgi:hypothetical protein